MKKRIKRLLSTVYGARNGSTAHGVRTPVLCYHSVNSVTNPESDPITPERFEQHLAYLQAHRTVVPLASLVKAIRGEGHLPHDAVVITFDDGYRDNFEVAYPLLRKYGTPATMFVVTGFVDGVVDLNGSPGWESMSWAQIRDLDTSRLVEIGAHSHTHAILSELDDLAAVNEVRVSASRLERELGHSVLLFAYPFGQRQHISRAAVQAVQDAGFVGACSTFWRTEHPYREPFLIGRVMINGDDDVKILRAKLEGRYDYIDHIQRGRALVSCVLTRRGVF
jgi:peptidoglycan/xylan/chitin deacetylase (PgdA/CDA1 family)